MSMHPLARLLLLSILLIPLAAQAVTLGEARVKSFLNQPLEVEIDLIGLAPGEHRDLRLRLANQQHFDRLGIIYEHFLNDLSFDIVQADGRWIVRARSSRPIAEPFVDFPLQMTWPGGQMIKQFTLLLDPPRRVQPAIASTVTQAAVPPAPVSPQPEQPATEAYGPVQRGETLWPIAKRLKPQGVTTRQMAMALLRANPQAFIDGNINRLRAGATLSIPSRPFIEQLDAATARAEFASQTRRWQAQIATSPRQTPVATPQTATKPDPVEAADEAAAPDPQQTDEQAQLRIVTDAPSTETNEDDEQAIKDQLLVTMEEIESNRITTDAIESRLTRLEDELARMQQLIDLKDAQIAALQSELSTREAIEQAAEQAEPPPPAAVTPPEPAPTASIEVAQAALPASPVITVETAPIATGREPASAWYGQYVWLVWALLALLGLAAIYLMVRRPQRDTQEVVTADLPTVDRATAALYQASETPPQKEIRHAADDFQALRKTPPQPAEPPAETAELPDLDIEQIAGAEPEKSEGLTNSLLDEMLEDEKHSTPQKTVSEQEISDDDIASWVEELGAEVERAESQRANDDTEPRSANDEQLPLEDDIPSILTELDDQLSSANTEANVEPADIELEPVDTVAEDDTFNMSLDLARAYLEIGDQEGAKDMLNQALASSRDPGHRRQIEELLKQID